MRYFKVRKNYLYLTIILALLCVLLTFGNKILRMCSDTGAGTYQLQVPLEPPIKLYFQLNINEKALLKFYWIYRYQLN